MTSPWAQYGASLLEAASLEERREAADFLGAMFAGDPAARKAFTDGRHRTADELLVSQLQDKLARLIPIVNASPAAQSPLLALNKKIKAFFSCGPDIAAFIFSILRQHVTCGTYGKAGGMVNIGIVPHDLTSVGQSPPYLWKSCKMACTLILLLASSSDAACLDAAATPSASLPAWFRDAKTAAVNHGKTTVLAVTLTDVHIFELARRGASEQYFSFAHVFTMGIGPDGVAIWQAWGKHGYRLDEYLNDGHARIRDWGEADQFVRDFDKLARQKGVWDTKCNKLYKKLFLIDVNQICGKDGVERPVTPKFKAWVRIHKIENVTYRDVCKLSWSTQE